MNEKQHLAERAERRAALENARALLKQEKHRIEQEMKSRLLPLEQEVERCMKSIPTLDVLSIVEKKYEFNAYTPRRHYKLDAVATFLRKEVEGGYQYVLSLRDKNGDKMNVQIGDRCPCFELRQHYPKLRAQAINVIRASGWEILDDGKDSS